MFHRKILVQPFFLFDLYKGAPKGRRCEAEFIKDIDCTAARRYEFYL